MGKRKPLPADMRPQVRNIIDVYDTATGAEIAEGLAWYVTAHAVAKSLGGARRGAGTLAALSPQTDWERNVEMAHDVYRGRTPRYATGANIAKARRCDAGEHWADVLGGSKVRNFAAVIEDPTDAHAVVIDRHAFDVAVGRITDDKIRGTILARAGVYEIFADAYRQAAAEIGVTPSEVQAVTWVVWRHRKGYDI
jgi:hypothetical protein